MKKKRIVLCADDYGQAHAISQGIIELIRQNRLSATSCIVNTPNWQEFATWLNPYQQQIDIGLHFNLTLGEPLSSVYRRQHGQTFFPLTTLLKKAFLRQLQGAAIEAECHAQIDAFYQRMGFLPHFLDGHQHVHQFPIIRTAILRVYEERLRKEQCYLRLVKEELHLRDLWRAPKKLIIQASGSYPLKRLLVEHKIPCNQSFAGIYPFLEAKRYAEFFRSFLQKIGNGGLIMCHPGWASLKPEDPLVKTRIIEYHYLASPQFIEDCSSQGVVLRRFYQLNDLIVDD